jgi:hypothetical protein
LTTNSGSLFEGYKPRGWILLTGAVPSFGPVFPDLADHLLGRFDIWRPMLGISAGGAGSGYLPRFIKELEDLTGGAGITLSLAEVATHQIEEAGIIVLGGGTPLDWLEGFESDDLERRLFDFIGAGGLVLAAGAPAAALGSWILEEDATGLIAGVGWLPNVIVLPGISDPVELPGVRELLRSAGRAFALGLTQDSALAVGPGGDAEVWSLAAPKLVLGKGWQE